MLNVYARAAAITSRYVGGLHASRNYHGDPGEKPPIAPISGADQKRALGMLNTYVFGENSFALPRGYFTTLGSNPYPDTIQAILGLTSMDAPIKDTLSGIQQAAMRRLVSAPVLKRVPNSEFKVADPAAALTLPDIFEHFDANVWSELEGHRIVGALRRQLQRVHLDLMIAMFVNPSAGTPDDAHSMAWD